MRRRHDNPVQVGRPVVRRQFLRSAGGAAGVLALAGAVPAPLQAARSAAAGTAPCGESVQDIINAALVAEQLATTIYYIGLTSPTILRNNKIAGSSANPNAVGRNGNPGNVAYLQAALDQEQKHAQILADAGAVSPFTHFYFPASAVEELGYTSHTGTYLWALDHLETAFIGAYMAAARRFGALGRVDLAALAMRILAVECQHRALYRVISGDDPADNVTLEVADFSCVADAGAVLQPYLTGRGFQGRHAPVVPISIPTPAQTAGVIGRTMSS